MSAWPSRTRYLFFLAGFFFFADFFFLAGFFAAFFAGFLVAGGFEPFGSPASPVSNVCDWNAKKNARHLSPGYSTMMHPSCNTPLSLAYLPELPWFMWMSWIPLPGSNLK